MRTHARLAEVREAAEVAVLGSGDFEGACAAWVREGAGAAGWAAVGWVLGVRVAGVEGLVLGWECRNGDAFEGGWFGLHGRWWFRLLGAGGAAHDAGGFLRGLEGEFVGINGVSFIAAGFRFGLRVYGLEVGVAVVGAATGLLAGFRGRDRDIFDIVDGVGNCFAGCFRELICGIVDSLLLCALAV